MFSVFRITMNLYDITKKLTGPISSVGESNADADRFGNLCATIELVDRLIFDINGAANAKDCHEASRAKIGKRAQEFLDDLRDSLPENVSVSPSSAAPHGQCEWETNAGTGNANGKPTPTGKTDSESGFAWSTATVS